MFEIDKETSRNMFPGSSFTEKGVKGVISLFEAIIGWNLSVRLNPVFEAEKLPTGIGDLHTRLSYMNRNDFSHLYL